MVERKRLERVRMRTGRGRRRGGGYYLRTWQIAHTPPLLLGIIMHRADVHIVANRI
jgi:hypothetical protein